MRASYILPDLASDGRQISEVLFPLSFRGERLISADVDKCDHNLSFTDTQLYVRQRFPLLCSCNLQFYSCVLHAR